MTDALDLDAIEARANAATEGPWHASKGGGSMGRDYPGNITSDATRQIVFTQTGNSANSRFIAHARTDIPTLIARCRDLQDELHAARVTIARIEAFERLLAGDRGSTTCEDIAGRLRYELGRDPRP